MLNREEWMDFFSLMACCVLMGVAFLSFLYWVCKLFEIPLE